MKVWELLLENHFLNTELKIYQHQASLVTVITDIKLLWKLYILNLF